MQAQLFRHIRNINIMIPYSHFHSHALNHNGANVICFEYIVRQTNGVKQTLSWNRKQLEKIRFR